MLKNFLQRLFPGETKEPSGIPAPAVPAEGKVLDHPRGFGYKCNWLAVPTTDTDRLAAVFGLTAFSPCNWQHGIDRAYDGFFFVSPPVDGWSFIVSRELPYAENDKKIALLKDLLTKLSLELGEAQYFGTYRVASYDGWMKAVNGQLQRAYAYVDGSNTIVEGEPTPIEVKFNLINTLLPEAESDPDYYDRYQHPDESITMQVAGAWSINPQDLDGRKEISARLGLLGLWRH